jgi:hypothetical protein
MKSNRTIPQSKLPRRTWLGAVAAVAAAWTGWKAGVRGTDAPRLSVSTSRRPRSSDSPRAPLVVRPSPDSVKRHG